MIYECSSSFTFVPILIKHCYSALTFSLILLVIIATIFDYYMEKTGCHLSDRIYQIIISFSARKNLASLSKVEQHESLVVFHGIRTVSCLFVIIMHAFAVAGNAGTSKNLDYLEDVRL